MADNFNFWENPNDTANESGFAQPQNNNIPSEGQSPDVPSDPRIDSADQTSPVTPAETFSEPPFPQNTNPYTSPAASPYGVPVPPPYGSQGQQPYTAPGQQPYVSPAQPPYHSQPGQNPYVQTPPPPVQNPNITYYQQPYYPVPQTNPGNGLGVASLVLGILSILLACIPFFSIIMSIVGLILGIIAKTKGCGGIALAGIITSSIGIFLGIILTIGVLVNFSQTDMYYQSNPSEFDEFFQNF